MSEEMLDFNIEPQPFQSALQQFAKQADLQLMYSPEVIPKQISPAIRGRLSAQEALAKLIQQTNLEFVFNGLIVVIRAQTLPASMRTSNIVVSSLDSVPENPHFIEEFIVTAQKREERLRDVPISILLAQGEDLQVGGINRLESLAPLMPGFHYSEAVAANDQLFIRGLGSGVNFGFENAVGQVIDDFYYGRSRFGRTAFLDVERVEILKGPQGALIGKNTTAGAINITSKTPTDQFQGWVSANHEFEADKGLTLEGAVSGPLSETLTARLALRGDKRDGWTHNSVTGKDSQAMDDLTGRLTMAWRPNIDFDATIRYQNGNLNRQGRAREISRCGQQLVDFIVQNNIPEDCKINYKRSAVGVRRGEGDYQNFNTDFDTFGVTLNWERDRHTLTSLTGYASYRVNDQVISDLLPWELTNLDATEEWSQWTQELRVTSNKNSLVDYIMGFYFIHANQTSGLDVHFADQPVSERATRVIATHQKGDSYAVFGQITWHINDVLSATAGARYTLEEEDARSRQFPALLYTRSPIDMVSGPAAGTHDVTQDRKEDDISPSFTLQWYPTDEAMFYGSLRKGFKGGGFDHQLAASQPEAEKNFQFNKEQVVAYEIGLKWVLGGGSSQINFALFRNMPMNYSQYYQTNHL
ncbi:MAG: TonB-dependent receptor [Pseudomonadales bacterium]|nr:TonB-dependent receptor [Pseudomonadales bacterium]